MRPLTAALALMGAKARLHGVARMHERPIGDLVDALRQLGCDIAYQGLDGYPPLKLQGHKGLHLDNPIQVRGDVSSQFLTALLLALPLVAQHRGPPLVANAASLPPEGAGHIVIEVMGELISKPYIDITLQLLAQFGVVVRNDGWQRFTILAGSQLRST
jgi:3-phosphoshikimate 1-carboxyvinyltransferase